MRSLVSLLAVAAVLVPAEIAAADPVAVTPVRRLQAGPVLAPAGAVLWGAPVGESYAIRSAAPGVAPSTLFTSPPPDAKAGSLFGPALVSSPTRVAFVLEEDLAVDPSGAIAFARAFTGSPSGPFSATAGDADGRDLVTNVDLSGDLLLTSQTNDLAEDARLFVRDLAAGTPAQPVGPKGARQGRIAGDLVAYAVPDTKTTSTTATIVVVDWRTGAELYRTTVPITPPYAFGFVFDLQADGTLAILQAGPGTTGQEPVDALAWASSAEPVPHVLASDVGVSTVKIAGGRILFERARGAQTELALADLAGTTTPVTFGTGAIFGADFDGTRLTWATPSCIYASDTPFAAPADPPTGACPQIQTALETRGKTTRNTVQVDVTCAQAPTTGCPVTLTLERRRHVIASADPALATGASQRVALRVSATRLRALRKANPHRKLLFLQVVAHTVDSASQPSDSSTQAVIKLR